jgi:nucleotide-binding universal stress UspA family protein
VRARAVLGLGTPASEIVETAKAERADLIAMTTHGRTGLRRAIFGSVAAAVLRDAAIPVLVIRKPAAAAVPASAEPAR